MQVSQNRMNRDYLPLELATFEVVNLGRNKGGFRWLKNVPANGKEILLVGLRNKLERLLNAVERELRELLSGGEVMGPGALETSVLCSTPSQVESLSRLTRGGAVTTLKSQSSLSP